MIRFLRAYYWAVRALDPHREWSVEPVDRWVWRHPRGVFTPTALGLGAGAVVTLVLSLWVMALILAIAAAATGLAALAAWLDPELARG